MLSGGIDSSLLVFLAKRLKLEGLVCIYTGSSNSEDWQWAQRVARIAGYPIIRIALNRASIGALPEACYYLSGVGSVLYFISKAIRSELRDIKVVWCGEGADELYGGYYYYATPNHVFDAIKRRAIQARQTTSMIERALVFIRDAENFSTEAECLLSLNLNEQLVNGHLVPLDFAFMANSMELRVPFLDQRVVQLAASLPSQHKVGPRDQKPLLKEVLRRISGIEDPTFYDRKKLGLLHGASRLLSGFRAASAEAEERNALSQHLPFESLLAGPFQRRFYQTIHETFVM
jgi:asparagine synthase (glutamine-hydrolysing)